LPDCRGTIVQLYSKKTTGAVDPLYAEQSERGLETFLRNNTGFAAANTRKSQGTTPSRDPWDQEKLPTEPKEVTKTASK
jgi:hypothetical protein